VNSSLDVVSPAHEPARTVDIHVTGHDDAQFVKVPGRERAQVPAYHIGVLLVVLTDQDSTAIAPYPGLPNVLAESRRGIGEPVERAFDDAPGRYTRMTL
jgi:hypothetical protein